MSPTGAHGTGVDADRRSVPRALQAVLVLVRAVFGITVLGAAGVLLLAASLDGVDGELLAWVLYGAAPGTAGFLLARRLRTGGVWVRRLLLATQGWFIAGALGTLADGGDRGVPQLVVPVLVVVLLCRGSSREWFLLPGEWRAGHRPFRLARMTRWRTQGGQTTTEYVGLVLLVAALIGALVVSGVGGQVVGGLRAAVCAVVGAGCQTAGGGGDGSDTEAGGGVQPGEGPAGTETGPQTSAPDAPTPDAPAPDAPTPDAPTPDAPTPDAPTPDAPTPDAPAPDAPAGDDAQRAPSDGDGDSGGDDDGDGGGGDDGDGGGGEGCTSGVGAFLSCGARQVGGFFEGVLKDGLWGDITGTFETVLNPGKAWEGIKEYGKGLGEQWLGDAAGAAGKWADGDYLGAVRDWGKASVHTGVTVLDDVLLGDDVRDMWNRGDEGQAVGAVLWNVGSLFIPGYGEARLVGKLGKLGKLGRLEKLGELGELTRKASEAAAGARRAAEAGDVPTAEKAAAQARRHADEAARKAGLAGCTLSSGVRRPTPYTPDPGSDPGPGSGFAVPGTGTGDLAAPAASVPVRLLTGKCEGDDPDSAQAAEEADREADAAERAVADARKKRDGATQWPPPRPGDGDDPRNYTPPKWAGELKDPVLGDADKGGGQWASRNRNAEPTWRNEAWLRYQEQISGVVRGREYVVPHPEPGRRAVEFDGWDADRRTFLEAKLGYDSHLVRQDGRPVPELTESGKARFLAEARGQVAAARGAAIEWHFSDPRVARAARLAFLDADLPVKVVHTPQKLPLSGPRKPGA
ncbi:Tox-REase-5 domain-containing protein [Streptomyces sp. HMX112]|uniref:Tox-REase-5 domain-containing protein n=1 Tax=Streptomyces sp. HMX112 TaxID=3390850 RepID=UPI003A805932